MSYNIEAGNHDLARIAEAIQAVAPDVVGLQEVDVHWSERSTFADQAALLSQRLGMQATFARIYGDSGGIGAQPPREFGVALLSRYPVRSWKNDSLTRLSTQEQTSVPARMPGLLEAMIDVRGRLIRVFDTHLDYRTDPAVRRQQVAEMVAYLNESSAPTVLLGDMNATPDAVELQPLLQRMADAWPPTAGHGFTYPSDAPVKRIDDVFISRHFGVRSAFVPATRASDHRPVVVDLVLVPCVEPPSDCILR